MRYRENVVEAASALVAGDRANWRLAELTYQNTRTGAGNGDQPERVAMAQWTTDIHEASGRRFGEATGRLYRKIWELRIRYGGSELPDWHNTYAEARGQTQEERDDARALSRARNASPEVKNQILQAISADPEIAPEVQQQAFQTLAATPAVAEGYADIMSPTARAVGELHHNSQRVHEKRHQERLRTDPVTKRFDESYAALDVEQACRRFATETEKFVQAIVALTPRLGQAGADDRYWITQSIERARATLDQLEVFATTGKSDLEGFLEETLNKR